jgi:hypothetical protein
MTIGFLFWLLMLLWLIFGLYWTWPTSPQPGTWAPYGPFGSSLLLFILLFLLGWKNFGFPIHGGP